MFKKILVAIDLDDDTQNDNLLRAAAELAKSSGAGVYLLNIVPAPPPDVSQFLPESYEKMTFDRIKQKLADVAANSDLKGSVTSISVRFGDAYREILAQASKIGADLIIVASHKPHVSDYLLGTTAARIVRHATCSTLVVRKAEVSVDD
jgi:universal stress protein F